jgi:Bacterial Ig domain/Pretoxin HINT domain/Bacterial cadherin-like domain
MNKIAAYAIFTSACTGFNAQAGSLKGVAMQDLTPNFLTPTATVVTFGVAGKINIVTAGAKTLATKLVAGGAAAGAAFDATLQAGLVFVSQVTDGVSGQEGMSLPQVLTSGALGAGLGGALAGAGKVGSELYKATPALVENMLAKIGRVIGLDALRSKQLLARELSSEVGVTTDLLAAKGTNKPKLQDVSTAEIYGETQIKVAGRVVATTPKASSLTLVDVATWFRGESNKVAGMIDKSLSIEAQIIQAQKLQQELMEGAVAALYDPALGATLREAFARPSIEKLMAEVGGAGEKQLKAVLDKLTAPDKTRRWFEPGACFAAGTLVHTKEGLVPIEQIKVGDWVLSKPENGGDQAYKRVLQTFAHAPERVVRLGYYIPANKPDKYGSNIGIINCTLNHPFWVKELGWTAADELRNHGRKTVQFEDMDGADIAFSTLTNVYVSDQPNVGWIPLRGNQADSIGALWDYAEHKLVNGNALALDLIAAYEHPDPFLKLPVYNLEVEDFHTYYVGEHGIWVHNQNCGGLNFEVRNTANAVALDAQQPNFVTRTELKEWLAVNGKKDGIYRLRAGKQSQAGLIDEADWFNWLRFEEGTPGRLVSSDQVRWEYATVFWDEATKTTKIIGVEGAEEVGGIINFIDRKLAWVKAGKTGEVMDLLQRISLRLKQNPTNTWTFEFNPGATKPELIQLTRAKEMLRKIGGGDPSTDLQIYKQEIGPNGNIVDVIDAEAMTLLRDLINSGRILARNAAERMTFPQNVTEEGTGTIATLTLVQVNALLPAARQYWLSAGASVSLLNSASFQIDDLPTGLAGQTQGKTITLDASGAGWGWFVDTTPTEQAEFDAAASSATSAYDFNAPLSSEAFGKLDLLTVLIHELGHVVGLPSTATADNVMSQYLAAGQRRLPDAVDIAALQAKGSPYYSIGTSVTLVAPPAGDAGSLSYSQLHPAAAVINPTLANGNFAAGLVQWASAGKVTATPSTLTLSESTTAQAHLAQAFVLSAQDRFLTFTVSGLDLQTNSIEQNGVFTAAPQDAFEVALQNANTGANLLNTGNGNLGTSHSDALLNVQLASSNTGATLQERAASGLLHTDNPDGSRTYVLDLSGIAAGNGGSNAGVAVNLSFDLIGFGLSASQLGSKVNISDVRLISTPLAVADTATLAEDGSTTITVQANDLNANAAGFAPRVVASAQHGQVSLSAPVGVLGVFGGFVYTPDANYFGTDSFTYQYSNAAGTELSNTATVSLTVTAVNDAPVAYDVPVATAEDNAVTINLVATDVDTAGTSLVFGIQRQLPVHASC